MGRGEQPGVQLARVAQLARATPVARQLLPRRAASVGAARLLVNDVLSAHAVSDRSVLDTAVLLASELATDGVQHGSGPDVLIEIALGPDLVQLTVTVAASRRPGEPVRPVAEHSQQVLEIMAAAWEVRVGAGARTGWCRIDRISIEPATHPDEPPPDAGAPRGRHPVRSAGTRTGVLRRIK